VNVLRDQCLFFTMPREIVESGLLMGLSPCALSLYVFLLYLAQKHSAVQIETVAYEIGDYTHMDPKSVKSARENLESAGLITCHKRQHGVIAYQLLNPKTGLPLPAPPGRRGVRQHRSKPGRSARTIRRLQREDTPKQESQPYPLSWDEISQDERGEPGEGELSFREDFQST
jgi:hypothetical protein